MEKFGTPTASGGLQDLTYADAHREHFDDGLDLRALHKHLDLTEMDRWNLDGFSYYIVRQAVRYIYDVYVVLMMGEDDRDRPVFHSNYFPHMDV